ncbi:MAG: cytochrome c [Terriglobales bacterium]|jgi:mono/diheme cytochrome c family protein
MNRNGCRARIFQTFFQTSASQAFLLALICGLTVTPFAHAQSRKAAAAKSAPESGGEVARGKYLVEGVAMCVQCHTPRDGSGNLDHSRWLQGAPVLWAPANGVMSNWPLIAPRIGGNPPASDADMVKLLTTGVWTNGKELRFPMMPFRMSEADAKAVVAYLKSVVPQK